MQNQKNVNILNHQFIRKPKRKQSPKQKNQNLYHFRCADNLKVSQKTNEEQNINQNQGRQKKNNNEIVLDLKNQLSFLKDQMAKIVSSKFEIANKQNDTSKLKALDYFFPSKTQLNQKSIPKQAKIIKSKERLKFSKIKKSQKYQNLSSSKKRQHSGTQIKDVAEFKTGQQQPNKNGIDSIDQSTLDEQIRKIGQKHRENFNAKIKTLLFQQQNINSNIRKETQSTDSKSSVQKQTINTCMSPVSNQIQLKKLVQQQQIQIQTFKRLIKQKTETIVKLEFQVQKYNLQVSQIKINYLSKQTQSTNLVRKVTQITDTKNQIQKNLDQKNRQIKEIKQLNVKLKEEFTIKQNKLNNREIQISKLQELLEKAKSKIEELKGQRNTIIQTQKEQTSLNQSKSKEEMTQLNNTTVDLSLIIKQLQRQTTQKTDKHFNGVQLSKNLMIKSPREQNTLNIISTISPRGTSPTPNRQKQLLNVIKMHEKSILNYQKDLSFLEVQCKDMNHFKQLSKKQSILIKQINQQILTEQITSLNAKYLGKNSSFGTDVQIKSQKQIK